MLRECVPAMFDCHHSIMLRSEYRAIHNARSVINSSHGMPREVASSFKALELDSQHMRAPDSDIIRGLPLMLRGFALAMLDPEKKSAIVCGARALDRFIGWDIETRGMAALISAGAAVMNGEEKLPTLSVDIPEITLGSGLASMVLPDELWFRLAEQIIGLGPHDPSEDQVMWTLGGLCLPSGRLVVDDDIPWLDYVDDSSRYQMTVRSDGDASVRIDASVVQPVEAKEIDDERLCASLLGLQLLFGSLPWLQPSIPLHNKFSTLPDGARIAFDRLQFDHAGVRVSLVGTEELSDLPEIPLAEDLSPPQVQATPIERKFVHAIWGDGAVRGYDPKGDLVSRFTADSLAFEELFTDPLNWRHPVADISSRLGRLKSPSHRIIATPISGLSSLSSKHEIYSLRTLGRDDFHLSIVRGENPYAVISPARISDFGRFKMQDHANVFVYGPDGELALSAVQQLVHTIPWRPDSNGRMTKPHEELIALAYRSDILKLLPWDEVGRTDGHPLSRAFYYLSNFVPDVLEVTDVVSARSAPDVLGLTDIVRDGPAPDRGKSAAESRWSRFAGLARRFLGARK